MGTVKLYAVHPHVRGEGGTYYSEQVEAIGSPPRAWGRRAQSSSRPAFRPVHPHVRGEGGKSGRRHHVCHRFTPTCVGKATPAVVNHLAFSVHPHVRGEGVGKVAKLAHYSGSPPRAWGRRPLQRHDLVVVRFTPTCVGKAMMQCLTTQTQAVHPHVRGEGKYRKPEPKPIIRFTPTCVGKAGILWRVVVCRAVHPHVRGEGGYGVLAGVSIVGSPPRAWGRLIPTIYATVHKRFTPTCVGKACCAAMQCLAEPVHPHVRGEGVRPDPLENGFGGSPPRAWGRR